ncbi:MAG: hypothetical protein KJZ83_06935 [Burkholderiaceae bacterium]|nr:hypothetical protein [Burkholderiaceae bacterium]
MSASSFISSFDPRRLPVSVAALLALGIAFAAGNWALSQAGQYLDANYLNMASINDNSWLEGGDVLFLGDSRGQQGLVPAEFEAVFAERGLDVSAFNLARPGMQTPFSYYFSKRALDMAITPPKVVVVNFSFYLLGGTQWMENIYWSYYRPAAGEVYQACVMRLMSCADAARWWARTRLPAWMFRVRANNMIKQTVASPLAMLNQLRGIYNHGKLVPFEAARGYTSMGYSYIEQRDVLPHGYRIGLERGYSVYSEYLNLMLTELTARGVEVYIYRHPWPESRRQEEGFLDVLDYYWTLLKRGNYDRSRVHFLDEVHFWPNELFVNPLHLNHPGATRLTRLLAAEVAARTKHFR